MDIGKTEDQLDLIQLPGETFRQKIRLFHQNGLFFVSNGSASKVMKFSSYGDLLALYYNEERNPPPVLVSTTAEPGTAANKRGFPFPFRDVGEIAVTTDGVLLVEDRVSSDREEYDSDLNTLLRNTIRRFGPDGTQMSEIGQEGIGGTPFPYIVRLQVSIDNDVAVMAMTRDAWLVYWYTSEGRYVDSVRITQSDLPLPGEDVLPSLDTMYAGPDAKLVYVKIDYYGIVGEAEEREEQNVGYLKSVVTWMDPSEGVFQGKIDLPKTYFSSGVAELFNRREEEVMYEFLGVGKNGLMFFLSPARQDAYRLTVMNMNGMVVLQSEIQLSDEQTVYRTFHVDRNGLLAALSANEMSVDVLVWRTDELIDGGGL